MAHRYKVRWDTVQKWSRPVTLAEAKIRAGVMSRKLDGPFRLQKRGRRWGPAKERRVALRRLGNLLQDAKVGDVYRMKGSKNAQRIIVVRKVEVKPQVKDTEGTKAVDVCYTEVVSKFNVQSWGICNCRKIAGSSTWSQHAYCNAWDIGGSVRELDKVANYLNQHKSRLKIAHVLWRTASHWDHVHVDFNPQGTGTPPCAK